MIQRTKPTQRSYQLDWTLSIPKDKVISSSSQLSEIWTNTLLIVPKWYSKVEIKLIFNPQNLNLESILLTTYLYCWKRSKWLKQQVRPARYIIAVKGLLSQGKSNHWMWLEVTGNKKKGRWRERSLVDVSESSLQS